MVVKNQDLLKNQEAKRLLGNLGLRTPLSIVPILRDILFWWVYKNEWNSKQVFISWW